MGMDWLLVIGVLGAALALVAFVGNEFGWISAESFTYDLVNLISAIGLLFYAYQTNAIPFMITNAVWALVSGIDVGKYVMKKLARNQAL